MRIGGGVEIGINPVDGLPGSLLILCLLCASTVIAIGCNVDDASDAGIVAVCGDGSRPDPLGLFTVALRPTGGREGKKTNEQNRGYRFHCARGGGDRLIR